MAGNIRPTGSPRFAKGMKEKRSMAPHIADAAGSQPRDDLYERDYYTWALEQAQALRTRSSGALDWDNLAEEVAGLARTETRELKNRVEVLLVHLLKWRYQSAKRSSSWRLTIREQRQRIAHLIDENPGLKSTSEASIIEVYAIARLVAARETGLAERTFTSQSPWIFKQITDADFWPNS
jgi:hypothetical protein